VHPICRGGRGLLEDVSDGRRRVADEEPGEKEAQEPAAKKVMLRTNGRGRRSGRVLKNKMTETVFFMRGHQCDKIVTCFPYRPTGEAGEGGLHQRQSCASIPSCAASASRESAQSATAKSCQRPAADVLFA
jgi:hypothetical protein